MAFGAYFSTQSHQVSYQDAKIQVGSKSVTLVIDYGKTSNRSIDVFDLSQVPDKATGWQVMKQARVQIQGTDQYPTGFACRINWWPSAKAQDCHNTPSATQGHWAYFVTHSQLGKGWILSGQGAASHIPDCGGYEGWAWIEPNKQTTPPRYKASVRGCK